MVPEFYKLSHGLLVELLSEINLGQYLFVLRIPYSNNKNLA